MRKISDNLMLSMYIDGKTLNAIGLKASITRERVRQILNDFPEYRERRGKNINNRTCPAKIYSYICRGCGEKKEYHKTNRRFCSMDCLRSYTDKRNNRKTKVCTRCLKRKNMEDFFLAGDRYRYAHCKDCHKEKSYKWNRKNPERKRESDARAAKSYLMRHAPRCTICRKKLSTTRSKTGLCQRHYYKYG